MATGKVRSPTVDSLKDGTTIIGRCLQIGQLKLLERAGGLKMRVSGIKTKETDLLKHICKYALKFSTNAIQVVISERFLP